MAELSDTEFLKALIYSRLNIALVAKFTHEVLQLFYAVPHSVEGNTTRIPFPNDTHGFLYYHSEPHLASLEGSLRFRVTPDTDPTSVILQGHDLLLPSGLSWQRNLPQLACHTERLGLRKQLLRDRLVTTNQLERCGEIFAQRGSIPFTILFRLDSLFLVDFVRALRVAVVGQSPSPHRKEKETIHYVTLHGIFSDEVDGVCFHPWTGMSAM
ncbi:hypothetical protein C8R43DRAFT_1134396 [Mycena crocata]|nr:hypothetical protein C8R43DRAFT_1134396 [Mycena crocata]